MENPDRLYHLLPAIYRIRDHAQGEPLRALLQIIAEQVTLIEDDIGRVYDNWFIETCEEWVIPYIGDLLGQQTLPHAGPDGHVPGRILTPRREIANTIGNRRRKGQRALLERLAAEVAGWPARAVEFQRLLSQVQSVKYPTPDRGRTVDLRDGDALGKAGGPFDPLAHSVDIRRIASPRRRGRHNIPSVGVFVWRLGSYSVTRAPAYCLEEQGPNAYMFSALGNDMPLFVNPRPAEDRAIPPKEPDLPGPISRRSLAAPGEPAAGSDPLYYGLAPDGALGQSFAIWAENWPSRAADTGGPVPAERLLPANLSDWSNVPPRDHIAVDPQLGRFMFPTRQLPKRGVWVSYHHGFPADMGGGEYTRTLSRIASDTLPRLFHVAGEAALRQALLPWQSSPPETVDDPPADVPEQPPHAIIEITDSGVYVVPVNVSLHPGHSLTIRAAQRRRPVIRLVDWQTDRPDSLTIEGGESSHFALDGILVAGRGIEITGAIQSVQLRHSTLVPGWSLTPKCEPRRPAEPSIQIADSQVCLVIEKSIVGSIQVNNDEVTGDPIRIRVSDSILDATGSFCDGPACEALGAAGSARAHATLTVRRSTVIGRVDVHAISLAENSIFVGPVNVARRQIGCIRFCSVPRRCRTPRRFNCQPDLAERAAEQALRNASASGSSLPEPDEAALAAAAAEAARRVRPRFTSTRYGTPAYCQLACDCPKEIVRGADDGSEMGAFHHLFQPQRLALLEARLDEYTPADMETGIILVT